MKIRSGTHVVALALTLVGALPAAAQQAGKVYRIGWLWFGTAGPSAELDAFRRGLRGLSYAEGQNLVIESRAAEGQIDRLGDLAVELVQAKVDVIAVGGTPGALAAERATSTIPVVFYGVADAIGAGLIQSLARSVKPAQYVTDSKAAKALGLTIPPELMLQADQVIE